MPSSPSMSSTTTTTTISTTPTYTTATAAPKPPPHPSNLHQFFAAPTPFLARVLYNSLPARRRQPPDNHHHNHQQHADETLTVVCVSDTHGQMPPLPAGDLLLHSGDLTASGSLAELQATLQWIAQQPHRYKVVMAGNRELCLDGESESRGRSLAQDEKSTASTTCTKSKTTTTATIDWEKLSAAGLVHLQNSSITLHFPAPRDRCIKIFGSPLSPLHAAAASAATAFQYTSAENPWRGLIPPDTDIVLTHTPPQCHLDSWRRLGCGALLRELWRVRPALHVFGHVHAGYGAEVVRWDEMQRLYEVACAGGVGGGGGSTVWALVKMAGLFVVCWASYGLFGGRWCWGDGQGETRMVNASASRGRGGEAGPQRVNEPIVVRL